MRYKGYMVVWRLVLLAEGLLPCVCCCVVGGHAYSNDVSDAPSF